ncbi:hypothetical protein N7466_010936 [Penicillium verhagenii]|uniref:uncharacterized protein n=1 Tax=Penicillium verhagenii TaxID=1562060 RepID=UPI002545B9DD|nr:uncharacterized protein N7466_010936 [Penicillium verhagenii]KAJ5917382.1 hypothetical protein N7466_010936 [Penicillium verhagenii]
MELSRQEYPALLERRRVEEAYTQGLRKLANRSSLDNGAALGVFQIPWQRILTATEALASSHETLATKIEEDVERPLREYSTKNHDMQSMPGIQSNLAGLAKNIESSQDKVEKAKKKSTKNPKQLAIAVAAAEEVSQQWDSRAPFVFEQLQAADEGRLNHLRDVLTQLETHEVDSVERGRQAAESCLNVLLNVQTADEIQTFAAKMKGNRIPASPAVPRGEPPLPETPPAPPPHSAFETPTSTPLAPPSRSQDDAASQRSERSDRQTSTPTTPVPEAQPRNTALGGLRRLGTVMGRRKSMVVPSGSTFDRKAEKKRSPFAPFKRSDSSRDMQIPESPPSTADRPGTSMTDDDYARTSSMSRDQTAGEALAPVPIAQPYSSTTNGTSPEARAGIVRNGTDPSHVDSEGFTERPSTVDEVTRAQREAAGLDESGMNLTIRDQPIFEDENQAKQAMDEMANTLRLRAPQSVMRRNAGTIRGRRDVRNTVFIANPGTELAPNQMAPDAYSPSSPIRHTPSLSTVTDDHAISDTTSVRSGHTTHGQTFSMHPELYEPGLNASIIETVNAWFSEGKVTKSFVTGELALAHNVAPGFAADSLRIRLDNFPILEKVAANPHFVQETSKDTGDEKRGEYNLQLGSISRPMPTVAFKYQLHLDQSNSSSYCPVIFKPAWNLQGSQASAIVFYSLNPAFVSQPVQSITLKNVILTVGLDVASEDEITKQPRESIAHATSAVMHPNSGATFRRKNSTVTWRIPELEVKAPGSGDDGKFLVRFSTSTPGPRRGNIEAKFELHSTESASRLGVSRAVSESTQQEIDPFADTGKQSPAPASWQEVPTSRKLVGGKYVSA